MGSEGEAEEGTGIVSVADECEDCIPRLLDPVLPSALAVASGR